jgi:hypothetical protein
VRIHDEVHYNATPDDVAAMLADPEFNEQVAGRMGAVKNTVDVDGDPAGAFTVTTVRTLPTDGFPDIARTFVGATVDVRQTDRWQAPDDDGSRAGTIDVEIVGAPLKLKGTLGLTPEADGTVETFEGDLKAGVPIIGGKLEKAAEPAIRSAIRQQIKVGSARLG